MSHQWTTACPDWRERIVARESLVPCPPLYPERAEEALDVFRSLQMTDLPRNLDGRWPTMGDVCEPFVFDLVASLFGSQNPETGVSRIKEAMLLISKKNGKSTIAAGIMLTALILNWRHGAELLVLAPTIEVANNAFHPAAAMVRADPELLKVLKPIDHTRTIKHLVTDAELKIVAADSGVVAGKKAGYVLVDELWQFGKRDGSDAMLEEATGGQAARPEGWTLYLTTHSDEPPRGVFKSKLEYFRDVRDGVIDDPAALPMLFEWPEDLQDSEAYLRPDMFYVTNPNIGKSPTVEFIQRKIAQCQAGEAEDGDSSIQIVLAKYLNVEIGMRLRRDRWAGADMWLGAAEPGLTLDRLLDRSEVAVVGIDGGGMKDLFGFSVVGREPGTGVWMAWSHAWVLKSALALPTQKKMAPVLREFVADGDLTLVDTSQQIAVAVADLTARVRESRKVPEKYWVGVDPQDMGAVLDELARRGIDSDSGQIAPVRQGVGLSSAIHAAEFKLNDRMMIHDGSAMMAWCVSNAKAVQKGNSVAIDKDSTSAKIDPLIAMLSAAHLMNQSPKAANSGPSIDEWIAGLAA